jgi:hypothetical protein
VKVSSFLVSDVIAPKNLEQDSYIEWGMCKFPHLSTLARFVYAVFSVVSHTSRQNFDQEATMMLKLETRLFS